MAAYDQPMTRDMLPPKADRTQLQQIIAGLNDGVILIDPDQTIAWANAMALALHGVSAVSEFGATVSEYRQRFELTYRNQHKLPEGDYPMERLLAGEAFSEVVVEVKRTDDDRRWVHSIRTLVLTDKNGQPDLPRADHQRRNRAVQRRRAVRARVRGQPGSSHHRSSFRHALRQGKPRFFRADRA